MIPYGKQSISQSDIDEVIEVLRSDFITQGPKGKEFERALARYCGARYAVACSNGTAALHLAYLAVGLGSGGEIITTPNTFAGTANIMLAVGARPVFCDIRPDTYNLDESMVEQFVTSRTRAIVPVHFAGQPCEMNQIWRIAKKRKLKVIEDGSHALGVKYGGKQIGGGRSEMTIFSFHAVKPITTGEGGAVVTDHKSYYEKMLLLRSHGIYKDRQGKNVMIRLGYNYRMTDLQAALGISQLKKLDKFIARRQRVARWYEEELKELKSIILPTTPSPTLPTRGRELKKDSSLRLRRMGEGRWGGSEQSGWHIYVIRVKKPETRDRLWEYLKKNGVGANFHYPAVYSHPYYQSIGYQNVNLPEMEKYQESCLTLPIYSDLKRSEVKYISSQIKGFYEQQ